VPDTDCCESRAVGAVRDALGHGMAWRMNFQMLRDTRCAVYVCLFFAAVVVFVFVMSLFVCYESTPL
jgi:hypothetical protein